MNLTNWTDSNGIEQITIDWGNEQFTSMLKETYDAQQADQNILATDSADSVKDEKPKK